MVMKNFSAEEEELIGQYLFTNPYGDTGFMYPQELVAGEELSPLMSAYSRTHVPFTRRVLQFLDTEKKEETRALLPHIRPIMNIFREADGTLKISRRTGHFNREWVLAHGHSSIKEGKLSSEVRDGDIVDAQRTEEDILYFLKEKGFFPYTFQKKEYTLHDIVPYTHTIKERFFEILKKSYNIHHSEYLYAARVENELEENRQRAYYQFSGEGRPMHIKTELLIAAQKKD